MSYRNLRRKWRRLNPDKKRHMANTVVFVLGAMVLAAGTYSLSL
ncbi:hypothetical protein AAIH25_10330 [Arthrobacter crystallopoietes]|jgi:hypothetical protein|nr:hypothetical protein [Arthrobacter sp. Marseille-P9274]